MTRINNIPPTPPIPPTGGAPSDNDPYWANLMEYVNDYLDDGGLTDPGTQADIRAILNALEPIVEAAGGATQQAFNQLNADFSAYCNHPTQALLTALINDGNTLAGATPPTFTWEQTRAVIYQLLVQYSVMVTNQNNSEPISCFENILMAFLESTNTTAQLPYSFQKTFQTTFPQALAAYDANPNPQTLAALQKQIQVLEAELYNVT